MAVFVPQPSTAQPAPEYPGAVQLGAVHVGPASAQPGPPASGIEVDAHPDTTHSNAATVMRLVKYCMGFVLYIATSCLLQVRPELKVNPFDVVGGSPRHTCSHRMYRSADTGFDGRFFQSDGLLVGAGPVVTIESVRE